MVYPFILQKCIAGYGRCRNTEITDVQAVSGLFYGKQARNSLLPFSAFSAESGTALPGNAAPSSAS